MNERIAKIGKIVFKSLLGLGGLVLILLYSGGSFRERVPPGVKDVQPGRPLPAGAATVEVREEKTSPALEVVGTIASEEKINLSSRLTAHVKAVKASAGQRVKAGDVLVSLDDRDLREQVSAAEAQLKQADAEYRRARQLFEAKAATEQALTAAESAFNAAKAQADRARIQIGYAEIKSPLDGLVTEKHIEAGDLAAAGQVLMAIYDPKRMRLEAAVPVRLLDRLPVGQEVEVRLDRPAVTLKGRVAEIVGEIDPLSRTQLVKVGLEGAPEDLPPGAFGRLLVRGAERSAIYAPGSAVYRVGQLEFAQVVRAGRVLRRLVKTGPRAGDRVEILSGLAAGETIAVNPAQED